MLDFELSQCGASQAERVIMAQNWAKLTKIHQIHMLYDIPAQNKWKKSLKLTLVISAPFVAIFAENGHFGHNIPIFITVTWQKWNRQLQTPLDTKF